MVHKPMFLGSVCAQSPGFSSPKVRKLDHPSCGRMYLKNTSKILEAGISPLHRTPWGPCPHPLLQLSSLQKWTMSLMDSRHASARKLRDKDLLLSVQHLNPNLKLGPCDTCNIQCFLFSLKKWCAVTPHLKSFVKSLLEAWIYVVENRDTSTKY